MRVFFSSPWIPAEWIRAHGHEPRGIWFAEPLRRAAPPVSAGVCAFAESVLRFAETQPDSAVIFTTACDQLRRAYDAAAWHGQSRTFLFNLPATQTPAARGIYRGELERLGHFLLELGGQAPAPEALRREMLRTAEARRQLRAAAPEAAARSFAESVGRFQNEGGFSAPSAGEPGNRVPLALVGGPLSAADWNLFEAIEAAGAVITLNAAETGERSLCPELDGTKAGDAGADPAEALADGYFENITDVYQRPNRKLYAWLQPRLASRRARGIVLWHFTRCDLWRAEAQSLREAFGLPVLPLEAGEAAGLSPRDRNGLQAFVEMLK
jgi:benzoyl-CoA reductase/2-hydroxyglutaryl-CoA dehydratase subunit BcrC/BadD/HgdB